MPERSSVVEIDAGSGIRGVVFAADGNQLVGSGDGVRVWRVEDGEQKATMEAPGVTVSAVSKDGRRVAAGTAWGEAIVWDTAATHEKIFTHKEGSYVVGVDFSPDSTRLVVASKNGAATVWDIAARKRVLKLDHERRSVVAAKYSPRGDRIATATRKSVQIRDSSDGRLLLDIPVTVVPSYNTGLVWADEHLWIVSDGKLKQLEASTGTVVSEWPVASDETSCIALAMRAEFIAYSTNDTVAFWDTSTHTQLGLIQHPEAIFSIALSPDDQFLAVGGDGGKITVKSLSRISNSIPLSRLHPTFQEPDVRINEAAFTLWQHDQLENAEASLTTTSENPGHHALASRALVRTRLRKWDAALADAEKALEVQPSVIGYIAKSVALVGKGERNKCYRALDIAFEQFHSSHVSFLLLIKAIIVFMDGEHADAISRVDDLIARVRFNSICYVVQSYMYLLQGSSRLERDNYDGAIRSFERAQSQLRYHSSPSLSVISLIFGWKFDGLDLTIRQRLCEALYASGRTMNAGISLLDMVNGFDEVVETSGAVIKWISDFTRRCLSSPQTDSAAVAKAARHHRAPGYRISVDSPILTTLLKEWAKATLADSSWKDALVFAVNFTLPRFTIYRVVCEHLEVMERVIDAMECFHEMVNELAKDVQRKEMNWILEFKSRCCGKLEKLGDVRMNAQCYGEAISLYSASLSLDPETPQGLFIKRSKAYLVSGLWAEALNDADIVIALDPLIPWGYERKHAALHQAGDYENAIQAFEAMLSKIAQSSDPEICRLHSQYTNPADTRGVIRKVIQDAIRDSPRVLINTTSGRLLDKTEQAVSFESLPAFNKLISSMTTYIDHACIEHEVTEYYCYAMFSHKWEENEPLFDEVVRIVVYDLEESHTHNKLKTFCKIVRDAGLHWAWSDTCCINKTDHFVLQEALVSMFKWYQGSALTLVLLRGVHSPSRRGDLVRSVWNTRAWTFQEYHASKVVRFYRDDWTLYMDLDIPNHKESPEILSEMEEATEVSAQALAALRPGLDDIREKLCLASTRQTTFVEDAAYSLLGIFSMSLPVVYGEGDQALGRLLAQLLTSSGDTSILAWTGRSGSFNSFLPASIITFKELETSHIPVSIAGTETALTTSGSRVSAATLASVTKLYDRLNDLPVPLFAGQRMKLPCIVFKLGALSVSQGGSSQRVFRAQTDALGVVEITTAEDLSRLHSLYLVHPWIDFLLDRQPVGSVAQTLPEERSISQASSSMIDLRSLPGSSNALSSSSSPQTRATRFFPRFGLSFSGWTGGTPTRPVDATSLRPPSFLSQADKQTRALRFIARLRQPFGALLLTPSLGNVAAYTRVAAGELISVQVREGTPAVLNKLAEDVRVLDVL